jgi:CheY-like chemotaxis protein
VSGDPTDLHQITMNLCTNAVQAMQSGGVLGVALVRSELSEQRVLARGSLSPGAYVRLIVSDTGSGIQPAILERIFDPFFTTKGVGQGTGLGLSLIHGIVNDLGGAIDVASTIGEGTRFDVWLPVAAEMPTPTREPSQTLPLGSGQTVMIVDDERALVALAEESIAQLGYEPVGFDSSVAALQAYRDAPDRFDAVVTDESMPNLSGTDLAQEIRLLRPSIPIILMSGHGSLELSQRGTQIGINEMLLKPVHSRSLAESLARVFGSLP